MNVHVNLSINSKMKLDKTSKTISQPTPRSMLQKMSGETRKYCDSYLNYGFHHELVDGI